MINVADWSWNAYLAKQAGLSAPSHLPAYEDVLGEEEELGIPREVSDDSNYNYILYLFPKCTTMLEDTSSTFEVLQIPKWKAGWMPDLLVLQRLEMDVRFLESILPNSRSNIILPLLPAQVSACPSFLHELGVANDVCSHS